MNTRQTELSISKIINTFTQRSAGVWATTSKIQVCRS